MPRRRHIAVKALKEWWTDPKIAAKARGAAAIRRTRALFAAIDDECRHSGTKLCILVVGPVVNYQTVRGESPLVRIVADWGLEIPVIDVAVEMCADRTGRASYFPRMDI